MVLFRQFLQTLRALEENELSDGTFKRVGTQPIEPVTVNEVDLHGGLIKQVDMGELGREIHGQQVACIRHAIPHTSGYLSGAQQ